jgi:hypothetical protein
MVVIAALIRLVRGVAGRIVECVDAALRTATRPVSLVGGLLRDLTLSPEELLAENTLLRQQLIVVARTVKKPKFAPHERGLLVILAHFVPRWRDAMLLVKPDTVLRWHGEGFRLFFDGHCGDFPGWMPEVAGTAGFWGKMSPQAAWS